MDQIEAIEIELVGTPDLIVQLDIIGVKPVLKIRMIFHNGQRIGVK